MERELTVRIQYLVEGVFPDAGLVSGIKELASRRGIGGRAGLIDGVVEMTLEGTPGAIGEFVTVLHSLAPRNSRIHRIVPVVKTAIDSPSSDFIAHDEDVIVEQPTTPGEVGMSDLDDARRALLRGESALLSLNGGVYLAVAPRDAATCPELLKTAENAGVMLLCPTMDAIFNQCRFNAAAVKSLVSTPGETVVLRPGEELARILAALPLGSDEIEVKLADAALADLFSPSDDGNLDSLLLARVPSC